MTMRECIEQRLQRELEEMEYQFGIIMLDGPPRRYIRPGCNYFTLCLQGRKEEGEAMENVAALPAEVVQDYPDQQDTFVDELVMGFIARLWDELRANDATNAIIWRRRPEVVEAVDPEIYGVKYNIVARLMVARVRLED